MIDPSFWIALLALGASIIFGVITASHNSSIDVKAEIDEAKKEAASSAKIETALHNIQSDTSEIKSDQKNIRADIDNLNHRLIKTEESLKAAWIQIDETKGND